MLSEAINFYFIYYVKFLAKLSFICLKAKLKRTKFNKQKQGLKKVVITLKFINHPVKSTVSNNFYYDF